MTIHCPCMHMIQFLLLCSSWWLVLCWQRSVRFASAPKTRKGKFHCALSITQGNITYVCATMHAHFCRTLLPYQYQCTSDKAASLLKNVSLLLNNFDIMHVLDLLATPSSQSCLLYTDQDVAWLYILFCILHEVCGPFSQIWSHYTCM